MSTYESIMEDINHIGKRSHQFQIVSAMAFLMGIPESSLQEGDPHKLRYAELRKDKSARIIHYLCQARTAILKNYKDLELRSKAGESIYSWDDVIPMKLLTQLSNDGASFAKGNIRKPYEYQIEINRLIQDRINNCKSLFPSWLKWDYIRNLFVFEGQLTYQGNLAAAKKFYSKSYYYPYGFFINWDAEEYGNVLYNDLKFCLILYGINGQRFNEYDKVSDVKQESKEQIYDFITKNQKILMIVDCENSNPYRLSSVLRGLDTEQTERLKSIILFDDIHTTPSWLWLRLFTKVPVEHKMIERIHAGKSMVDMSMALTAQEAFLNGTADAFIIVSSDSDYWTLIKHLPNANFLLLVERAKCSEVLKNALAENDIFYCFMDDFYSGNKEMEKVVINKTMREYFSNEINVNFRRVFEDMLNRNRMDLTDVEKEDYFKRLVKNLSVEVDEEGALQVETSI